MDNQISRIRLFSVVTLFIILYASVHIYHINADTPASLTYISGTYCDEGYKTWTARNLILFDKTHWSPYDEYQGWVKSSPITIYFNYHLFDLFGVSLGIARLGNFSLALFCLVLFYLILQRIYGWQQALVGLIIAAASQLFFFYSRLALYEFKVMFFVLLGLYLMLFVKRTYFFVIPVALSWIAAYYCKGSAQIFFISVAGYLLLSFRNEFLLKLLLKRKYLIMLIITAGAVAAVLQLTTMLNRELYDTARIFSRGFRSPAGTIAFWIGQEFFTKNPLMVTLAVLYSSYFLIQVAKGEAYCKYDLLFIVWLFLGTFMMAAVTFAQLLYYILVIFPLVALTVRSVFNLPHIIDAMFSKEYRIFKWLMLTASLYLLIIHVGFLPYSPIRNDLGWDMNAVRYLAIITAVIFILSTLLYIFLSGNDRFLDMMGDVSWPKYFVATIVPVLILQLIPVTKWLLNPKYELKAIFNSLQAYEAGTVFAGDWAPQICVDTTHKSLYTVTKKDMSQTRNFYNLDKIRPDFLVIVDTMNDHMLEQFRVLYPGIAEERPQSTYPYAGKTLKLYKLNFDKS